MRFVTEDEFFIRFDRLFRRIAIEQYDLTKAIEILAGDDYLTSIRGESDRTN